MSTEARQLSAMIEKFAAEDPARATIVESWERCIAAGLQREGPVTFKTVPEHELHARLDAGRALIRASEPVLRALHATLPGTSNVVYVTDADGIVLCVVGDADRVTAWGLTPGHDWSEATMGTNGAGTCLATGRPVAVVGPAHFMTAFHDCTCTAAPIRGRNRRMVGALDVSSAVSDAHPLRIQQVVRACERIEGALP